VNPEDRTDLLNRLRSAEGHVHAIITMVEAEKPCEDVLHQMRAVVAAMSAAERALCYCEFRRCADIIVHHPDQSIRLGELRRLVALLGLPFTYIEDGGRNHR
jgi:DNA-binding FrmR family transcriptional regulator